MHQELVDKLEAQGYDHDAAEAIATCVEEKTERNTPHLNEEL